MDEKPIHVELTPKPYKAVQTIGGLLCLAGIIAISVLLAKVDHSAGRTALLAISAVVTVVGLAMQVIGRIMAWWHHG
jgi:hypothetical protein